MEVHERIGDPYQFIHQYRRHDRVRPSAPLAPENGGLRRIIVHAPVDVAVSLLHGSLGFRYPHPLVRLLDIDPLDALCRSYPHGSWLSFVRRTCVYRMLVAMQMRLSIEVVTALAPTPEVRPEPSIEVPVEHFVVDADCTEDPTHAAACHLHRVLVPAPRRMPATNNLWCCKP